MIQGSRFKVLIDLTLDFPDCPIKPGSIVISLEDNNCPYCVAEEDFNGSFDLDTYEMHKYWAYKLGEDMVPIGRKRKSSIGKRYRVKDWETIKENINIEFPLNEFFIKRVAGKKVFITRTFNALSNKTYYNVKKIGEEYDYEVLVSKEMLVKCNDLSEAIDERRKQ